MVTIERLEHGLKIAASMIETFGPVYLPLFERLEAELRQFDKTQTALARVKRVLMEAPSDRPSWLR